MKRQRNLKYVMSVVLVGACLTGCETVKRARTEQESVQSLTNEVSVSKMHAAVVLKNFSLLDYAAFAMTNRPTLVAARLAVSNAFLNLYDVTSERALQLALSGGYSQSTANRTSHFSWHQPRGRATTDFSFDLLICDFGRLDAREQEAREHVIASQRDLATEEFSVFDEVAQAYFTLLRNDALLEVAHTNVFTYAEHVRQAELLFQQGESRKLDVLKARVDLSDAQLALINASNDVATASAEFLRTLGLSATQTTRADVLEAKAGLPEEMTNMLPVTVVSSQYAFEYARTNAPALKALRAQLRAANSRVDYAISDLLPELTLTSAFSFADPTWNWSWGFRAFQTLMDGGRKQTAVNRAVVALQSARTQVEGAEQRLATDLAVATASRDNAHESLRTARIEVAQARENFENVRMQYRVGDASRLDFTDAADTLTRALGTRVKAFYATEMAEATLMRLTGSALAN